MIMIYEDQMKELIKKKSKKELCIWACRCAGRVVDLFDKEFPKDLHPRIAIESGIGWVKGQLEIPEIRRKAFKSHESARKAKNAHKAAACFAARSCGHACATAHAAGHAIHAAAYARKAIGENIDDDVIKEAEIQLEILKKINELLTNADIFL